jgi:hypothetical protein
MPALCPVGDIRPGPDGPHLLPLATDIGVALSDHLVSVEQP